MRGRKTRLFLSIFVAAALLQAVSVLAGCGCGPSKPVISSIEPDRGLIGTGFRLKGTDFGETVRKSVVTVGGKRAQVQSWSETAIKALVPLTLRAGKHAVTVRTEAGPGNQVSYTVYATFTGETPLPAMLEFLKNRKIDTTDVKFEVVSTSELDPEWKLDRAVAPDGTVYYFLFRKTADGWTIKEYGTSLTEERMRTVGSPGDIKAP